MSTMVSTCSMSTGHCSDAGAARRARPQHVGVDRRSAPASRAPGGGRGRPESSRSAEANRLSRRSHDERASGESGLPVVHAGTDDWQRPHSVQVAMSSSCFQVKSSMLPGAEDRVLASTFSMSMSGVVFEPAEGARATRGQHVDRRQEDVEVLRVGDEDEEAGDDGDVEQQERPLSMTLLTPVPSGATAGDEAQVRGRGQRPAVVVRGSCRC